MTLSLMSEDIRWGRVAACMEMGKIALELRPLRGVCGRQRMVMVCPDTSEGFKGELICSHVV